MGADSNQTNQRKCRRVRCIPRPTTCSSNANRIMKPQNPLLSLLLFMRAFTILGGTLPPQETYEVRQWSRKQHCHNIGETSRMSLILGFGEKGQVTITVPLRFFCITASQGIPLPTASDQWSNAWVPQYLETNEWETHADLKYRPLLLHTTVYSDQHQTCR